ncbi:4-hydroxy-tetrahydrodipicolinate reductase [Anaeromyxobacter diazotrophicus]|uniref:4-hydroxy-tetrahydrodipicolinate reductase n=1 Tax=Anaeromyxobacter diazotrophicus TaxID=2590199 RepID=A0A7I9VTC6_9BACT|nr:4-hydroxy-tetrahydrodipicolinate reductase [Anaeromyxobacter diazotrophicus]GEJ59359.1 4-hydroxy-tetrahydrodipicolinate reductase [Anaeromyxobacter diazotrophicus]
MIRVVVTGVSGRMGGHILRGAREEGFQLTGATERPGFAAGLDAGTAAGLPPLGVPVSADLRQALRGGADVVIDFTSFEASAAHAELCAAERVALVVGSTGFTKEARARVEAAARQVPVVLSPNMSVGVNVLFELVRQAAAVLGDAYDVELVEMHHRKKKDAPSGTAMRLAEVAAEALGRDPAKDLAFARHGIIGERPPREIGVQTLRGGDVVGEHTVYFVGEGERLELTHRATSRDQFARGALRAARWVAGRAPGLYDMADVLGLRRS